ncbi:EamA family transporter [Pedobacter sp. HDW13]|uniref:DMT family transporter n=1 Tax=Pedobacter sp. HDW13 TaxID=2714940 RepID=UPI00140CCD13|nr:DMT family transporter [Pedobacter sp. HDW13]QIL38122.1 EamA family transporter [Pedobacter sp. HDW13]
MEATKKNLLILHLTVFVWGFTGVLGKVISIDAVPMVWYRVLIAAATLFAWFLITRKNIKITRTQFIQFFLTGAIVAIHWIFFFHAIKVSTVSVTLVCLSSFTLFTAILEPIIKKQPIQTGDIFIGLLIILGIYMIFKFEGQYTLGIIFGLLAAVASSLFSIINSTLVQKSEPSIIGFYELLGGLFWITLYRLYDGSLLSMHFNLSTSDWFYLALLGTLCTSVAYVAGVSVMRTLSAFRVALITNLEPVYGILLAFIFFQNKEQMTGGFYIGATIILGAIFLYPIYKKRKNKL